MLTGSDKIEKKTWNFTTMRFDSLYVFLDLRYCTNGFLNYSNATSLRFYDFVRYSTITHRIITYNRSLWLRESDRVGCVALLKFPNGYTYLFGVCDVCRSLSGTCDYSISTVRRALCELFVLLINRQLNFTKWKKMLRTIYFFIL